MGTRQEELDQIQREKDILANQDKLKDELKDLRREVLILRKGKEVFDWEDEVEENEDVDGIPVKRVEDDD